MLLLGAASVALLVAEEFEVAGVETTAVEETGTTYEVIGTRSVEHEVVKLFTIVVTEVPHTVEVVYSVLVLLKAPVGGIVLG